MDPSNSSQSVPDYNRLQIPGIARIETGQGGFPRVAVDIAGAHGEIYLHGAHVAHYSPPNGKPLLFLSKASYFAPGKPIRGGVPLIFPWFGPHPTNPKLPAHGFARTREWELQSIRLERGGVTVELTLSPTPATRELWPHNFQLNYLVHIGPQLEISLTVRNTGDSPFTFEEAFHTYLSVADVRLVKINGLAGRDYLDKMKAGQRLPQAPEPITIVGETDRVYLGTPDTVTVDESARRQITVAKTGSLATVVWNPWIAKSKTMADFVEDEWPTMLCIETANAAENAVVLAPGEQHVMAATISQAASE
jgi:glucose-6-phosphate 1-epimerase